jgi:hypothetical protein
VLLQRNDQVLGKHRHPVLATLAIANDDLAALELDVLDPQAQAFHEPHARAVEEGGDKPLHACHLLEERSHFAGRQHDRELLL